MTVWLCTHCIWPNPNHPEKAATDLTKYVISQLYWQPLSFKQMPVITLRHWYQLWLYNADAMVPAKINIMLLIYIDNTSESVKQSSIDSLLVSASAIMPWHQTLVMIPWHWCCGVSNDSDNMMIICIDHTSKSNMLLLIGSLLHFSQCQHLCCDAGAGNDTNAMVPVMPCWSST